jgi:hypothetical protein
LDVGRLERLTPIWRADWFPAYVRSVADIWRANGTVASRLSAPHWDLGRFIAGMWALLLDATPGGLTTARLSQLLGEAHVSGFGRAPALVLFLRFIGFIELAPRTGDGRVRRLQPTAAMMEAYRERNRWDLELAAWFDPAIAEASRRLDEPAFFGAYMAAVGEFMVAASDLLDPKAVSLSVLSHRIGGMVVLGELLSMAPGAPGRFPPGEVIPCTLAGLATRCGISRMQTRRILNAGIAAGFFEDHGEGKLALTAMVIDHVEMITASSLLMFRWAAGRAIESVDARRAASALRPYSTQPPSVSPPPV